MRLIDADEFKKQIAGMAIVNNYSAAKVNKMCELIDCQPTVYDVDKVVEQIKTLRQNEIKLLCEHESDTRDMQAIRGCNVLQDAIEIVKAGMKE